MNIIIKTTDDIAKIKQAVAIWKKAKAAIISACKVGVSLLELNDLAKATIESYNATPTFYKMYGFSKDICISVNDCVIHGVPDNYRLQDKDIVTFDMGVTYLDHVCDAAFTVIIGHNEAAEKIKQACEGSLLKVREIIKPGTTNLEIAKCIQEFVESHGYYVLRDFTGHGCGNKLHEDPPFPNYVDKKFPVVKLKENMVFCLEPMILSGSQDYYIGDNDWNVYAVSHGLTCHCEDMFLVTKDGCIVLTQDDNESY